jgi:transmembrane sensor
MSADPIEEAARWDARLRADGVTEQDFADFQAWRRTNPDGAQKFDLLGDAIGLLRANAHRVEPTPVARRRGPRWVAGLAALAASWFLLIGDPAGPLLVYRAGAASKSVELADGSRLELSPQSEVEVRFRTGTREARLLSGKARFSVTSSTNRPFVVTADDRQITADNNVFDVMLATDQVRVATLSGAVRVRCWHGLLPRVMQISQGQRMIAERGTDNARVEPLI